jgi:hypothetical protein
MIPNVQAFRVAEHIDFTFNVRRCSQNHRNQHLSLFVNCDRLAEILRSGKEFAGRGLVRIRPSPFNFFPHLYGVDPGEFTVFVGNKKLGATTERGKNIRRDCQSPFHVNLHWSHPGRFLPGRKSQNFHCFLLWPTPLGMGQFRKERTVSAVSYICVSWRCNQKVWMCRVPLLAQRSSLWAQNRRPKGGAEDM